MRADRPIKSLVVLFLVLVLTPILIAQISDNQIGGWPGDDDEGGAEAVDEPPVVGEPGANVPLGGTNEPAIAVNPLNPINIAASAGLFALRVSNDNGASFSATTLSVVPAGYSRCGDSSLAFDSRGRLFWTYLGCRSDNGNFDVFIAQADPTTAAILPGYPVNVTAGAGFPASAAANNNDKEWLAADRFVASPNRDRLYVVWTRFDTAGNTFVQTTFSNNQGVTWSPALILSAAGEGFVWPSHNAVAINGDVYVSYHSQPTFTGGAPNGTTGQVFVLRSTNGGVAYPQKSIAFAAGLADITFNVQTTGTPRRLNGNDSWTQGSAQAWVVPDALNAGNVSVVAADDPTDTAHGGANDDFNVYVVRSTNSGATWTAPTRLDSGPGATTQFFPTAGGDDVSRCLVSAWYDTRGGATNTAGNFLLDVFLRGSVDGGATFGPEVRINDVRFDPDLGASARFAGPPPTRRIGEYIGVAVTNGLAHLVWTGNTTTGQQTLYDNITTGICPVQVPVDIHPQSCPNPINTNSKGVIPVAILGTTTFDVTKVDVNTVRLAGVPPLRSELADVSTPVLPLIGKQNATDCTEAGPDGFLDLTLKFDSQTVVAALGAVTDKQVLRVNLTGKLLDGTPIVGQDVVVILKK